MPRQRCDSGNQVVDPHFGSPEGIAQPRVERRSRTFLQLFDTRETFSERGESQQRIDGNVERGILTFENLVMLLEVLPLALGRIEREHHERFVRKQLLAASCFENEPALHFGRSPAYPALIAACIMAVHSGPSSGVSAASVSAGTTAGASAIFLSPTSRWISAYASSAAGLAACSRSCCSARAMHASGETRIVSNRRSRAARTPRCSAR